MHVCKQYLITVLLLLVIVVTGGCGNAEEQKAAYRKSGEAFYQQANYEKARLEFKNVLKIDAKDAEARFWLGKTLEQLQRWQKAVGQYLGAAQLDTAHVKARIKLAQIFLAANVLDKALTYTEEVLAIAPKHPEALVLRGTVHARQENYSSAMADVQSVLQASPQHANAIALLSSIYMSQDQSAKALALIEDGISSNPDHVGLLVIKAGIHIARAEMEKAALQLEEIIHREPDQLTHRYRLAGFYVEQKQFEKAEQTLQAAVTHDSEEIKAKLTLVAFLAKYRGLPQAEETLRSFIQPNQEDQQLRFVLAKLYAGSNQLNKARSVYEQIIAMEKKAPDGLIARSRLAEQLRQQGLTNQARSLVREVLEESPRDSDGLMVRARIALAEEDPTSAIADLRAVQSHLPDSTVVLRLLAQAQMLSNQQPLAEDNLEKAFKLEPQDMAVRGALASLLIKTGDIERANTLISDDRDKIEALYKLYAQQQDWTAALQAAQRLATAFPDDPAGYYLSGVTLQATQKYQQSIGQFDLAIEKAPNATKPLTQIVRSYIALGKTDVALERVSRVLLQYPNSPAAHNLLGDVLLQLGQLDEAEQAFIKAMDIKPDWDLPYARLAAVRRVKGDQPGIVEAYKQGLAAIPDAAILQTELAQQYQRQGDYETAIHLYESILQEVPDSIVALNNLALLLVEHRTDQASLDKAADFARRLAGRTDPTIQDTVGWVYYQLGDYDAAVKTLQGVVQSAKLIPPIYHYHLGMAYFKQGDKARARTQLERAIQSNQAFADNDQALAVLDSL